MKTPISQSRARNNAKAYNDYFAANYSTMKTEKEKKRKNLDLSETCIKALSKRAIDENTNFKHLAEDILERSVNPKYKRENKDGKGKHN